MLKGNETMIFETHAHYDNEAFDEDREALLLSLPEKGIGTIVNVGASIKSTAASIELAQRYPFIYAAAGVHPSETAELNEENFAWLQAQCMHDKVVAVGEIGLDYYWDTTSRDIQKLWFARQLALAKKVNKPVIIHSREAAKDTYDMLVNQNAADTGGVIHCYSYSVEMALDYVKMGFYIGIGGVVTFKNAKKMVEVVEAIPIEKLLLETDSPYLAPQPYRGQRNTSLNLIYVAQKIAEIKKMPYDEVVAVTECNARKMYRLDHN